MKLMHLLRNAAAVAVLLTAGVAQAAILQFTVTGDYTAQWQLDTGRTPDEYATDLGTIFWDVAGNFPGASAGIVDVAFFNGGFGGGLSLYDLAGDAYLLVADGLQVYTGTEFAPVFGPGTFALTEYEGAGRYVLTVSELAEAAVPEPATGALLFGGVAMFYVARRRQAGK